ncbi:restriction endonuclease subunit S [Neiella marina]|uniref:Restriction endonuclease subunit S n=1 Tax=Neiella holothuriorum TaxID=2870530 RepID=A0ABS7EHK2_9GAMM|nr:restriction endonuclease subunit S [Neiella holothuriorum]MBW8191826.1 restriction endonuclease subunit S [Neiella holothuriorum]
MVPSGWKKGSVEDIATVTSGGTPSRKNDSYWNGHIPWVTTSEVKFGVITDTEQKITQEGLDNSSAKMFPENTLLIAMYGQGKTRGQVAKLGIEASTNQACAALLLNDDCEVDYYFQFLTSQYDAIRELANSGGQQNLSAGIIKNIHVPIPPLPEQRKIAKILATWDKAIATSEKLIAASQQQKKALMQQLLTGKKRLTNPDTGQPFEGEWEEVRLESYINLLSGHAFKSSAFEKDSGYKLLRGINITRGTLRWGEEQTFSWTNVNGFEKYLVNVGDIVISMDGSLVGRNYALITENNHEPMLLVQRVARIRCKTALEHNYLLQHIASERFKSYVDAVKTVTAIPHISAKDIKHFMLPLPSVDEQQKISSVLTAADKEIEVQQAKLAHLKQEKKALMQQLLTGKRRVKTDEQEAA